jgi:putative oxidoreductase
MLRKLTSTSASWAPVPLRLALGVYFSAHGMQKVFGWFGGHGFAKFTSFPAPFSFMRPSAVWMGMAAIAELVAGVLVLLGLVTRVGAFLITCVMLTAIFGVLWPKFFQPDGMELAVAFLAMALALLILGGGQASVDRLIRR